MLTGLVVGKFCPFHKGHEALIAFARARCDRLVILSYTKPDFAGCTRAARERWLEAFAPDAVRLVLDDEVLAAFAARGGTRARILPHNDDPEETHRGFVAWVCRAMLGLTVACVFTGEAYGDGFAASLARRFGHPVDHVAFDRGRTRVPVSGTRLRDDPALHRELLSDPVRRDLVRRIALIGGESTGKTTLAADLAARLGTAWVPEYGRTLWEAQGGRLDYADLQAIATEQVAREEAALADAAGWLVCDTSPLVTLCYSLMMYKRAEPALIALADRPYAHSFLCAPDFAFVQDGTRRDAAFRRDQDAWYGRALMERGVPYHRLSGPPQIRVEAALQAISANP